MTTGLATLADHLWSHTPADPAAQRLLIAAALGDPDTTGRRTKLRALACQAEPLAADVTHYLRHLAETRVRTVAWSRPDIALADVHQMLDQETDPRVRIRALFHPGLGDDLATSVEESSRTAGADTTDIVLRNAAHLPAAMVLEALSHAEVGLPATVAAARMPQVAAQVAGDAQYRTHLRLAACATATVPSAVCRRVLEQARAYGLTNQFGTVRKRWLVLLNEIAERRTDLDPLTRDLLGHLIGLLDPKAAVPLAETDVVTGPGPQAPVVPAAPATGRVRPTRSEAYIEARKVLKPSNRATTWQVQAVWGDLDADDRATLAGELLIHPACTAALAAEAMVVLPDPGPAPLLELFSAAGLDPVAEWTLGYPELAAWRLRKQRNRDLGNHLKRLLAVSRPDLRQDILDVVWAAQVTETAWDADGWVHLVDAAPELADRVGEVPLPQMIAGLDARTSGPGHVAALAAVAALAGASLDESVNRTRILEMLLAGEVTMSVADLTLMLDHT